MVTALKNKFKKKKWGRTMPPVVLICRDIDIHFAVPSGNGFFMQEWHAHCSLFKWQLNQYRCG
jgi:hypothetical protein